MHLRAELKLDSPAPSPPSPFPAHALDTNTGPREVSASTGDTDAAASLQSYNVRGDRFYLAPSFEPVPETPVGRAVAAIGEPEVFQLGNKRMECSLLTAVKRRNPLCLLNATVFHMAW